MERNKKWVSILSIVAMASIITSTVATPVLAADTNPINFSCTQIINSGRVVTDNTDITSKFTDTNFKTEVYTLIGKSSPAKILYSDVKNITHLDVPAENISSLSGIEYFTALTYLGCGSNPLKTIDVSKNTALTELGCYDNQLTTLDISKNTALTELYCGNNQLTTLDVSKNTKLTYLDCGFNQLIALNVRKNTALTELFCAYNKITTIDVSKNIALTNLDYSSNKITTSDIRKNTALSYLDCSYNQLTTLDVSKNISLTFFHCANNQLSTLYSNTDIWDSSCYRPQYTDSTHTSTSGSLVITIKN